MESRALRSFYGRKMFYVKATQSASSIGKFFAFLMAIFGIRVGNLWFTLIDHFIYVGASEEELPTQIEIPLKNILVKDIMKTDFVTVSISMSLEDLIRFMFEKKYTRYPILEGNSLKCVVLFINFEYIPYPEHSVYLFLDTMIKNIISFLSN
jgi:hypothetical protein